MSGWRDIDNELAAHGIRMGPVSPCSTDGSRAQCPLHREHSLHYLGRARDYGDKRSDCLAIVEHLRPFAQGASPVLCQLFYAPTNDWWVNGRNLNRGAIGDHDDHVHAAISEGAAFPHPVQEDDMPITILDPKALPDAVGRQPNWEIDAKGDIYCWDGARQLKSLSQVARNFPAISGAVLHPSNDGVILFGADGHFERDRGEWGRSSYTILVGM